MFPFYNPESQRGWAVASICGAQIRGVGLRGALARWRVARTLRRMAHHPEAPGNSDIGVQNLLFALAVSLRPRRVLEIGAHIGTGAVVIGHALTANGYGRLLTLEPAEHYRRIAARNARMAGVAERVEIVPLRSDEEDCRRRLAAEAPFELIFVDGAHDYASARHDIGLAADLVCDNGIIVCHDVGEISHQLDQTGRGGARQAFRDFREERPDFTSLMLEFPVWLNNTGTALLCKERLPPAPIPADAPSADEAAEAQA